jgi:hypothetical protein
MVDPLNPQALGGLLKRSGHFEMTTFDGRLILQKTVYLWDSFGVPTGYPFNWYVRGPYSPPLTAAGFQIKDSFGSIPPAKFVDPNVEKRFQDCLSFVGTRGGNARWLELVASIHFLAKLKPNEEKTHIYNTVAAKMGKPQLARDEFDAAWKELAQSRVGKEIKLRP